MVLYPSIEVLVTPMRKSFWTGELASVSMKTPEVGGQVGLVVAHRPGVVDDEEDVGLDLVGQHLRRLAVLDGARPGRCRRRSPERTASAA